MIEVLHPESVKVFAMRVSGKLLHQDYQQFVPLVEKQIETHGGVRCYIEMIEFQGIELRALWDEIKFDVRHAWQIERFAIVGDRAWEAWMTNLSRPIFGAPKSASSTLLNEIRGGSGSLRVSRIDAPRPGFQCAPGRHAARRRENVTGSDSRPRRMSAGRCRSV